MTNYRLLEKGEIIQEGDMCCHWDNSTQIWSLIPTSFPGEAKLPHAMLFRPIPEPNWNEIGKQEPETWPVVCVCRNRGGDLYTTSCDSELEFVASQGRITHWRPLTLPQSKRIEDSPEAMAAIQLLQGLIDSGAYTYDQVRGQLVEAGRVKG